MLYRLSGHWWCSDVWGKTAIRLFEDFFLFPGGDVVRVNKDVQLFYMTEFRY